MPAHARHPLRCSTPAWCAICLIALCLAHVGCAPRPVQKQTGKPQAQVEQPEARIDLFELLYAYEVADAEHARIRRHGYHWVTWKGDNVWPLFDANPDTWIEPDPAEDFALTVRLKKPVTATRLVVGTANRTWFDDRVRPFRWSFGVVGSGGVEETLCDGELRVQGELSVPLPAPVTSRTYVFRAYAVDENGNKSESKETSCYITNVAIYGPEEVAYLWASPAQALTFDKSFLPFLTTPGQSFDMRAWKISNAGTRTEDASGITWSSSDPGIAQVGGAGHVTALKPGEATIRASLTPDIYDEVPVRVMPEAEGNVDLDLIWVERLIRDKDGNLVKRDWDAEVTQPQPGESLVYLAHIINVGEKACQIAQLSHSVDGLADSKAAIIPGLPPAGPLVDSGSKIGDVPLLRHQNEQVVEFLEMPFDGRRHAIEVRLDARGDTDANPDNNALTVWSDAITLGYYMSESSYHGYSAIQREGAGADLPEGFSIPYKDSTWGVREWNTRTSTSYDRLQRIVRVFNEQFTLSKHALTPDGIAERINAEMYIIPDPDDYDATFGVNGCRFGELNKTIDLIWGYVADTKRSWAEFKHSRLQEEWRTGGSPYIDVCMIHEVSHARYLIDIYGSNLWCKDIHVLNPDGSRAFPDEEVNAYDLFARIERHTPEQYEAAKKRPGDGHLEKTISGCGNMVGGMGYENGWCEHCAYSWERVRGRRARSGTWNASPELGEFLNVIPDKNVICVRTPDGAPCPGAALELFRCEHDKWHKGIYAKIVDNVPDVEATTDAEGKADLGPMPFGKPNAEDEHGYHAKGVYGYNGEISAVLRITYDGRIFYKILTVFDANLGYWYKYGLEIEGWPKPKVRDGSGLVYVYTIDPAWSAEEEMSHRGDIPTTH